jgi:hypothetical protein
MTTIFRALRRAGLIMPHNQTDNHRRVARRDRHATWIGRGYSLKPLLVRLPEFSQQGRRLEQDGRCPRQAVQLDALIRQMRRQLAAAPMTACTTALHRSPTKCALPATAPAVL